MSADLLYDQSQFVILLTLLGLLLVAGEVGHRVGRAKKQSAPESVRTQVGNIQSALFGLFALLLAFTFAMSLSRFDSRRQVVVRESNAIGTAALRAQLLPAAEQAEMMELFRRYVDVRLNAAASPNLRTPAQHELDAQAARLQEQLWQQATAAATTAPSVSMGLLLASVNELIDVKTENDAALANHVPESVLLLLFVFAILASGVLGYGNGLSGTRAFGTAAILAILITLFILVTIDLDRPRRGLIRVSQESMINLQKSLNTLRPGP